MPDKGSRKNLPLGTKARLEVRKFASENPELNLMELSSFTGYTIYEVADALRGISKFKYIIRHWNKPGPPPRVPNNHKSTKHDLEAPSGNIQNASKRRNPKPQFIKEIEAHTGLECIYRKKYNQFTEWIVMSPTKVPLFAVYGRSDILQGCLPPKPSHIQGLPWADLKARRHKKRSVDPADAKTETDEELDSEPD